MTAIDEPIATRRSAWGFDYAEPEPWMVDALCAQIGGDAWYPEKGESTGEAKKICLGCPVAKECLDYALAHDERFGVWGGLSERERRHLRLPAHQRNPGYCRKGLHKLAETGVDKWGSCVQCKRDRQRRRSQDSR